MQAVNCAYSMTQEDINVADLCYKAMLPAVGNSRKLLLEWRGPVEVTELINATLFRVKELYVNRPWAYVACRSIN